MTKQSGKYHESRHRWPTSCACSMLFCCKTRDDLLQTQNTISALHCTVPHYIALHTTSWQLHQTQLIDKHQQWETAVLFRNTSNKTEI